MTDLEQKYFTLILKPEVDKIKNDFKSNEKNGKWLKENLATLEKLKKISKEISIPGRGDRINYLGTAIIPIEGAIRKVEEEEKQKAGGKRKSRKTNRKPLRKRKNTLTKRRYRK